MKNTNYKNIPSTGFKYGETETKTEQAITLFNHKGTISLSIFSIIQLVEGAKLLINQIKTDLIDRQLVLTYMLLTNNTIVIPPTNTTIDISVDRKSMTNMKDFLLARMAHCERERDNREIGFNADTYIAQKMLLLEIKEWLMGEVILVTPIQPEEDLASIADAEYNPEQ